MNYFKPCPVIGGESIEKTFGKSFIQKQKHIIYTGGDSGYDSLPGIGGKYGLLLALAWSLVKIIQWLI